MTTAQKTIQYIAIAFAIVLIVGIFGSIASIAGTILGVFEKDGVADDVTVYTVSSDIDALEIEIGAANLSIKTANRFSVESNLKYLTVEEDDGTLVIKEQKKSGVSYNNAVLTLYVPEDFVFSQASVMTGAGRLNADVLSAERLELTLGAGAVEIGALYAQTEAKIEGGTGEIIIRDGLLRDLRFEMGVGALDLTAALYGNCELQLGVGETNLTVLDAKEQYRVEIEKGIGSITVDGKTFDGSGTFGDGKNRIEIEGGIGAIGLRFSAD